MSTVTRRRQGHTGPATAANDVASSGPETFDHTDKKADKMDWYRQQPVWLGLAVGSGLCAAVNGVFAKLTTTALTNDLASHLALMLGLSEKDKVVNLLLRGVFLGLNVLFNIIMWSLFTAALTRASSTTKVSIVNVSANFFLTAVLGAIVFGESLPLLWWAGASLLAAGNIIIGRRDDESVVTTVETEDEEEEVALLAASTLEADKRPAV